MDEDEEAEADAEQVLRSEKIELLTIFLWLRVSTEDPSLIEFDDGTLGRAQLISESGPSLGVSRIIIVL